MKLLESILKEKREVSWCDCLQRITWRIRGNILLLPILWFTDMKNTCLWVDLILVSMVSCASRDDDDDDDEEVCRLTLHDSTTTASPHETYIHITARTYCFLRRSILNEYMFWSRQTEEVHLSSVNANRRCKWISKFSTQVWWFFSCLLPERSELHDHSCIPWRQEDYV